MPVNCDSKQWESWLGPENQQLVIHDQTVVTSIAIFAGPPVTRRYSLHRYRKALVTRRYTAEFSRYRFVVTALYGSPL